MSAMRPEFDDFLGLAQRDFSRHRAIVFLGESGSGKSTAIEFLLRHHPHLAARPAAVMDEILHPAGIARAGALVARGATLLAASHLHAAWFLPLRLLGRTALLRTDRDHGKIERYLQRRGVDASRHALRAYVRRYGATYTDLELILERFPGMSFDAALARFAKLCRLELARAVRLRVRAPARFAGAPRPAEGRRAFPAPEASIDAPSTGLPNR
jgi:hypothetical protein